MLVITIFVIILLCVFLILYSTPSIFYKDPHIIVNPPKDYWFWRSDGTGKEFFKPSKDIYIRQTITNPITIGNCTKDNPCSLLYNLSTCRDGNCSTHVNSEIYNNPCCMDQIDSVCKSYIDANTDNPLKKSFDQGLCDVFKTLCAYDGDVGGDYTSWNKSGSNTCKMVPASTVDSPLDLSDFIRDTFINNPYRFVDMKINIKMNDIEKARGSRGWGFWNTAFGNSQLIWFINLQGREIDGTPYKLNGFFASIYGIDKTGKPYSSGIKLPTLDNNLHEYQIIWKPDQIDFIIDSKIMFTEKNNIPSVDMAFHSWLDNVLYNVDDSGKLLGMMSDFFDGVQSQDVYRLEFNDE